MNQKVQRELDLIKESILKTVSAEAIYLFGSYAYGTPSAESDIDIYVVVPDIDIDLVDTRAEIRHKLWRKQTMPLDLLIGKSSVFNRRKQGPTLERAIAQKGKIIYGS
ncbi:MAG: nucleotidyltransferase domain-containing protein [Clostridiales Family XIII bacterium]|nr:nucleotidyltransferase domain-containing protein [Clostridiales Family XIII bacterium]